MKLRPPPSLLVKELRELSPIALLSFVFVAIPLLVVQVRSADAEIGILPAQSLGILTTVVTACLGAFVMSRRGDGLLYELPISPERVLATKALASLLWTGVSALGIFAVISHGFGGLSLSQQELLREVRNGFLLLAVAWCLAACLRLLGLRSLTAALCSLLALMIGNGLLPPLESGWRIAMTCAFLLAAGHFLRVRLSAPPRGSLGFPGPFAPVSQKLSLLKPLPFRLTSLWRLELRRLALPLGALWLLLGWTALALDSSLEAALLISAPVQGAVLGTLLFSERERENLGFFTLQLPFSRLELILRKSTVWLFNGALLTGFAWLTNPQLFMTESGVLALESAKDYLLASLLAGMLAPRTAGSLLPTLFSLLTWFLCAVATSLLSSPMDDWLALAQLSVAALLFYRSALGRDAFEPHSRKLWRLLTLVFPFWAHAFLLMAIFKAS